MSQLDDLLADYPEPKEVSAKQIAALNKQGDAAVLVVLDDDPTGTQSVADLPVLTSWSKADFEWGFKAAEPDACKMF